MQSSALKARQVGEQQLPVIITLDSPQAVERLRALGVKVQARFPSMITATVPVSVIPQVCRVAGVKQLSVSQAAQLCNDSALSDAHVPPLAQGMGFSMTVKVS